MCRIWPYIGTDKLSFGGAQYMLRTTFYEDMHATHHILLTPALRSAARDLKMYIYMLRTTFYEYMNATHRILLTPALRSAARD
jgi:hypothetical protein